MVHGVRLLEALLGRWLRRRERDLQLWKEALDLGCVADVQSPTHVRDVREDVTGEVALERDRELVSAVPPEAAVSGVIGVRVDMTAGSDKGVVQGTILVSLGLP